MKTSLKMAALSLAAMTAPAMATTETMNSPSGGALPTGVTQVGGLVADLIGSNGSRVVAQLAASQMYRGYANSSENPVPGVATGNPLLFGTQTGFDASIITALGGGITSASFRITLFDGDSAPGNFDFNENTFLVNGIEIGNWSSVTSYETNGDGTSLVSTSTGFGNNILSTGFFTLTDTTKLTALFASLGGGSLAYTLNDVDPYDNYFDFTQGVDGGLINSGKLPVITPPNAVPEPTTWAMMIGGFAIAGMSLRRRKTAISFA